MRPSTVNIQQFYTSIGTLADGSTSDLPLFSERHSSAACAGTYLPSSLASSSLYSWRERVANALSPTRRDPIQEDDQLGTFLYSSLVCRDVSDSPAVFGSPLFQMHQLHFAVTGFYNPVSLLLVGPLHISHSIGQVSMVQERGRQVVELPLSLSHSTKLRYTLFQTASFIPRHLCRYRKYLDAGKLSSANRNTLTPS
jgi:hypothetical protein